MSSSIRHIVPIGLIAALLFSLAERSTESFVHGDLSDGSVTAADIRGYLLGSFALSVSFSTLVLFPIAFLAERCAIKRDWLAVLFPVGALIISGAGLVLSCVVGDLFSAVMSFGLLFAFSVAFCLYWLVLFILRAIPYEHTPMGRSLHTTPDGVCRSAFADHVADPACVSSVVPRRYSRSLSRIFRQSSVTQGKGEIPNWSFGPWPLLFGSMVVLSLAGVGWCGLLMPELRVPAPSLLTLTLFAAPVLMILAVVDIFRMGWTLHRIMAFLFSLSAFCMMVFALYERLHHV